MSSVYSFFTVKGGTGKTTLAILLASYLHHNGKKVLVIDADAPAYNLHNLRQRELTEYGSNPEPIDKHISNNDSIYPVIRLLDQTKKDIIDLKQQNKADYIIIDMPGSLTDSNAIELVSSNFIDHAIMPTILDQAVIVSNIKAAIQLKKYIPDVRMLWNNTLHHEKEQLYQQHTATIEDSYNINVCKCRVKNSGYLRREYGSDSIFIKSTLCYPEKTIKEKKLLFNDIFQELL